MKILFMALLALAASAEAAIPDFTLQAYRGKSLPLVGVIVKAPAQHHFNLKAPMSARTVGSPVELPPVGNTEQELRFEVENASVTAQDSISVSAYLCDDAKTYCVKKTGTVALASAGPAPDGPALPIRNKVVHPDVDLPTAKSAPSAAPSAAAPAALPAPAKVKPAKDKHGFWNDVASAEREARKLGKPLLIDFFGIWCPPCNLLDENVYPSKAFQAHAKSFVLLKVDADTVESWPIKSRYKVGGYPTIVFARPDLEEIDRMVGYFPPEEFAQRMKDAYANRKHKLEEIVMMDRTRYLDGLQRLIDLKDAQHDGPGALQYAQEGLMLKAEDPFFRIVKIAEQADDDPKLLKQADTVAFLRSIWESRANQSSTVLLWFQNLFNSHADAFSPEQILWAVDAVDQLKTRVNERTLQLDGRDATIADLDAFRVDLLESAKKPEQKKQAVKNTISSYRRLMQLYHGERSRGLNLELAYYLDQDGQVDEATKIYESFMKQYPKEFTYYYAAIRHYQESVKDLKRAREVADLALQYSYGDNRLRAMTKLLNVRAAQGDAAGGIEQARKVLAEFPSSQGMAVRTGRYVKALEKEIDKAGGKK